jgi:hypothetical protein
LNIRSRASATKRLAVVALFLHPPWVRSQEPSRAPASPRSRSLLLASKLSAALVAWLIASCASPPRDAVPPAPPAPPEPAGPVALEPASAAPVPTLDDPPPQAEPAERRTACAERHAEPGPWPPTSPGNWVTVVPGQPGALGSLEQVIDGQGRSTLRFLGTHLFDLLDKLEAEGGPDDASRRRLACAALNAAALRGAPVVRLWGSLKRTGGDAELDRTASLLALLLDENSRRKYPIRFVVALLNHQAGYGSPSPERSLDSLPPGSPWAARRLYLEGGWRAPGQGLLADRIRRLAREPAVHDSPYILAWELVNELDTHRLVGPSLQGPAADRLIEGFARPALEQLAAAFPQPIALGDLRGPPGKAYARFARRLLAGLPPGVLARVIWTSHAYATLTPAASHARRGELIDIGSSTRKLDIDLALAAERGAPFLLGELGQLIAGATPAVCEDGPAHDLPSLFSAVLSPARAARGAPPGSPRAGRAAISTAIFWGEGECSLRVEGGSSGEQAAPGVPASISPRRVGAGGDSADLGPLDLAARQALVAERAAPRWLSGPAPAVSAPPPAATP